MLLRALNGSSPFSKASILTTTVPEETAVLTWLRDLQSAVELAPAQRDRNGSARSAVVSSALDERSLESAVSFTAQKSDDAHLPAAPVQCSVCWSSSPELIISLRADHADPAAHTRMLRHWCTLVENIVTSSGASVGQLDLLSAAERAELLQTPAANTPGMEFRGGDGSSPRLAEGKKQSGDEPSPPRTKENVSGQHAPT